MSTADFVFEPQTLTITAPETNTEPVVVVIAGQEATLNPGEQNAHSDGDGIPDDQDACPAGTNIPESVPTSEELGKNRWALMDGDLMFDQGPPQSGSKYTFTINDARGCSCEQIVAELGLGQGHTTKGCSTSVMLQWVNQ